MNIYKTLALLLVAASILVSALYIFIAANRTLTTLEMILLQLIVLSVSLFGSFVGGRQFTISSADQSLKRHAKSAFRRTLSLYRGLSRIAKVVAESTDDPQTALAVIGSVRQ